MTGTVFENRVLSSLQLTNEVMTHKDAGVDQTIYVSINHGDSTASYRLGKGTSWLNPIEVDLPQDETHQVFHLAMKLVTSMGLLLDADTVQSVVERIKVIDYRCDCAECSAMDAMATGNKQEGESVLDLIRATHRADMHVQNTASVLSHLSTQAMESREDMIQVLLSRFDFIPNAQSWGMIVTLIESEGLTEDLLQEIIYKHTEVPF